MSILRESDRSIGFMLEEESDPEELEGYESYELLADAYHVLKSQNGLSRFEILEELIENPDDSYHEIAESLDSQPGTISENENRFQEQNLIDQERNLEEVGEAIRHGFNVYLGRLDETLDYELEPLEEIEGFLSCLGKRTSQGKPTSKMDAFLTFMSRPHLNMDEIAGIIDVRNPKKYFQEFEEEGLVTRIEVGGPRVTKYRPTEKGRIAVESIEYQLDHLQREGYN